MKKYYEILGVDKNSSSKDIKKAYRSLSMKYHPDHNSDSNATEKMAEINEAYETLSDDNKKQEYDNQTNSPFKSNNEMNFNMGGHHDMNEIFKMFGGSMFGGGMFGDANMDININGNRVHIFRSNNGGFQRVFTQVQKPEPIVKQLSINIEDAYNGCEVELSYTRWSVIDNNKVNEEVKHKVQISRGATDQDNYTLKDQGNKINDQVKGDVKIIICVDNNSIFQRRGNDLYLKRELSLKEALCGFGFEFKHLSGKNFTMNNNDNITVITPGYTKVIPNLGMPINGNYGNLIIEFDVKFPDKMTSEQISELSKIL